MHQPVDPKLFGLHPSTKLEQTDENKYVLVLNRKSRIIMKDGEKIVTKAAAIKKKVPHAIVSLRTNAPICSKTKTMLKENKVELIG